MANKNDYYYKQTVTEAELDSGFDKLEDAVFKTMSDQLLQGIFQGAAVSQRLTPALSVDVEGPSLIYDQEGRRIFWSPAQVVSCATDENGNPTAVVSVGNAKVLSVFAEFDRLLSDPRTDGNGATVYFERDEHFKLNLVQGAEAVSGAEVAPPLRADQILLCDITLVYGATAIVNADIDMTTRRQDVYVLTGSPNNEREGTTLAVLQAFQDQINAFINGGAIALNYSGGGAWADGTANPATSIEGQLDKVITDLAVGAGAAKIITAAGPAWADGTTNPAERLDQRIDSIITDLAVGAGAAKIITAAGPAWHDGTTNPAERVDQRIDSIVSDLVANAGADRIGVAATPSGVITGGISVQDALAVVEARLEARRINRRNIYFGKHDQTTSSGTSNTQRFLLTGNADSVNIMVPSMVEGGRINGFAVYGVLSAADHYTARLMKRSSSSSSAYVLVGTLQTSPVASGLHLLAHNLATPSDGNIAGALGFIIQIQLLHDGGAGTLSVETLIADIQDDI